MTTFTHVDQLAAQLPDGGPSDEALEVWQHALGLLEDARERLRALTAPGVKDRALQADRDAVVAAAAARKPTPAPAAVDKLEADLAEVRRLVAALETFTAQKRQAALDALAADAPRRLKLVEERTDELLVRARSLAGELTGLLVELDGAAADRALLVAVAGGNQLQEQESVRLLHRAVTRATSFQPPRDTSSPAALLAGVLAHSERVAGAEIHAPVGSGLNRTLGVLR